MNYPQPLPSRTEQTPGSPDVVLLRRAWPALFGLLLFLVPLVFLGTAFDPFKPVKTMIVQIFCAGALLAWLGGAAANRGALRLRSAANIPWAMFLAWLVACMFFAQHKFLALNALLEWACAAVLFFSARLFLDTRSRIETALTGALAAAPAVALLGLLELRGMDWFPWDYLLANPLYSVFSGFDSHGYLLHSWIDQFEGRISSSIGNPVYAAGYAALLLPPALGLYLGARRRARAAFGFLVLASLSFILIASFTRSAWASSLVSLGIFAVLSAPALPRERRRAVALRAAAVALAAALMFALFSFRNPVNTGRFSAAGRAVQLPGAADPSAMQRALIWKTTLDMAADKPLMGTGLGQYIRQYPRYAAAYNDDPLWKAHVSFPDRAHNDVLELWAETGAPGALLFAAIIVVILVRGAPRMRRAAVAGSEDVETALLRAGLFSGLIAMLLYSNFQFPFHVPPAAACFWVFAGMLLSLAEKPGYQTAPGIGMRSPEAARSRAIASALCAAVFAGTLWLTAQPVISHLLFGRGIAVENRFPKDPPEVALHLMETARAAYAYEPEMCVEMMRALLLRANREQIPAHMLPFYAAVVRHPDLGKWRALWHGRLPDAAAAPPWGRAVPAKVFYYANTVRVANQCLVLNPSDIRPWAALGRAHFEMRMPEESAAAYETALQFAPNDPQYLHAAGDAYMLMQDYDSAARLFERALREAPDFLPALFSYGETLLKLDRARDAQALYREAIKKDPKNPVLWKFLGKAHNHSGDVTVARKTWEHALELDPNFLEAAGDLAVLLYNTGNIDKGIELLEDIIAKAPPGTGIEARAAFHLGQALLARGDREHAVSAFRRAAALFPDEPLYRQRLDEVLEDNEANRTP